MAHLMLTLRERNYAAHAVRKLAAEQVDTRNREAVKACLLRCVAGRLLWRAWQQMEKAQ